MKARMRFIRLKLFSPVIVKGETPYENPWDGSEDFRVLTEPEKKMCRKEIYDAVSETLDMIVLPAAFERKVYSAVPAIEEKDGKLMLVLNCECYRTLSEAELDELCDWWEDLLSGCNESLCRTRIKTPKFGRIYVHVWFLNGWTVEPVYPD